MDDGEAGVALLDGEDDLAAPLQAGDEGVAAAVVLEEEQGEVGGEALAQPDVVPVALGDGVAEPLVRDLVGDEAGPRRGRRRTARRRRSRWRAPSRR